MKKRLGIYATYDEEGRVDDYIIYCLEHFRQITDYSVVVSNGELTEKEKSKIAMADRIYERSDQGFDAGGFAHVIRDLAKEEDFAEYDEVVFMNDSAFGPIYPFETLFQEMDKRPELDFWGITKRGISDFDGGEEVYPEHIQLYFFVVRKRLLHSRDFLDYWKSIPEKITDFRSAVIQYEFAFTKYFEDKGYLWDVYCDTEEYCTKNPKYNLSPYHYDSYGLIKNKRCPLLKRKLFTGDFVEGRYTDKTDLRKAFDYIQSYTDYDTGLIWKYILRHYHLGDIMNSLQLCKVAFSNGMRSASGSEPVQIRMFPEKKAGLEGEADNNNAEFTLIIRSLPEEEEPDSLTQSKLRWTMNNVITGQDYLSYVARHFKNNPSLGVVIPPARAFGKIYATLSCNWADKNKAKELYQTLNLHVPFKPDKAPVHLVEAFWCRSSLLSEEIIAQLNQDESATIMQMMTLAAQEAGYYTEVLVNEAYAACLLTNMQVLLNEVLDMSGISFYEDADMEAIKNKSYEKEIRCFSEGITKLYIYGAGQLAVRSVEIIKKFREIDGIVVSDKNGNSQSIGGYPVKGIRELDLTEEKTGFVVAVGKKNHEAVESLLKEAGAANYLLLS